MERPSALKYSGPNKGRDRHERAVGDFGFPTIHSHQRTRTHSSRAIRLRIAFLSGLFDRRGRDRIPQA
jgi:hypothetical protein